MQRSKRRCRGMEAASSTGERHSPPREQPHSSPVSTLAPGTRVEARCSFGSGPSVQWYPGTITAVTYTVRYDNGKEESGIRRVNIRHAVNKSTMRPTATAKQTLFDSTPQKSQRRLWSDSRLMRSQAFCLRPQALTFDSCLPAVLLFLTPEEIGRLCFLAGGAALGGSDSAKAQAAWHAVCTVTARRFDFLRLRPSYPGGWAAQWREQLAVDSVGFWAQRKAAVDAAKAATAEKYPDIHAMYNVPFRADSRLEKPYFLRKQRGADENRRLDAELIHRCCSLTLTEQQVPACLARIRELLALGVHVRGHRYNGIDYEPKDTPLYACQSVEVTEMLLAAGQHPDSDAYGLENGRPTVLDVLEEKGDLGPKNRLLRQHGGLTTREKKHMLQLANDIAQRHARRQYELRERAILPSVLRIEKQFGVQYTKAALARFARGEPRVLSSEQVVHIRRQRQRLRSHKSTEQLLALDRELLSACSDATRVDNVLDLLLRGADPDFWEGPHYWPCPLTEALYANHFESVRLLLAAGADTSTTDLEHDGEVGIGVCFYYSRGFSNHKWIHKQKSPLLEHLLTKVWGLDGRDLLDIDRIQSRFFDATPPRIDYSDSV